MSKASVLVVAPGASRLDAPASESARTGLFVNELAVPVMACMRAGYDIVLATPSGAKPVPDERSCKAAYFHNDEGAMEEALEFVERNPAMQEPRALRTVIEEGLDQFAGVFMPGGHPLRGDLMQDSALAEILHYFHECDKPTALLCHGPAALIAAVPRAKAFREAMEAGNIIAARAAAQGWLYTGYSMTVFSHHEEALLENETTSARPPYYAGDALEAAGGVLMSSDRTFQSNVVLDRELITGQNPSSDRGLAALFVNALARQDSQAFAS